MKKYIHKKNTVANNYAFIDSQNLNLGVRSLGWTVDYKKLRLYLKNKYGVQQAFVFIGLVQDNQKLYTYLQKAGFVLVFKPTIKYFVNGIETIKGNVDAELVLHAAAIEYNNYDKAIIITADGDFACLMEYLRDNNKLHKIITPTHKYSQLLNPYSKFIVRAEKIRHAIEHQKNQTRRSVETLGVSGHGDDITIAKKAKKSNIPRKKKHA